MTEQLLTPQQQQETATRVMHDAELLQNGAAINALGKLVITKAQYGELHSIMTEQLAHTDGNSQNTIEQAGQVENEKFSEQGILDFLKNKPILGSTHMYGEPTATMNVVDKGSGFGVFYGGGFTNSELVRRFVYRDTAGMTGSELKATATQAGITELVTFEYYKSSGLHWMTYETTCRENGSSKDYSGSHRTSDGRPGNYLRIKMPVTEDEAISWQAAIRANPELVHRLTDTLMLKHFEMSDKEWSRIRPDYESWRELSADGQNRLAIRQSLNEPIEVSKALPY